MPAGAGVPIDARSRFKPSDMHLWATRATLSHAAAATAAGARRVVLEERHPAAVSGGGAAARGAPAPGR